MSGPRTGAFIALLWQATGGGGGGGGGPAPFTLTFEKADYSTAAADYLADYTVVMPTPTGTPYPGVDSGNNAAINNTWDPLLEDGDNFWPSAPVSPFPQSKYFNFVSKTDSYVAFTLSAAKQIRSLDLHMMTTAATPKVRITTTLGGPFTFTLSPATAEQAFKAFAVALATDGSQPGFITQVEFGGSTGVYALDNMTFTP